MSLWKDPLSTIAAFALKREIDYEIELEKKILVKTSLLISFAALIWSAIYITYGELRTGLMPLFYASFSIIMLIALSKWDIYNFYRSSQILLILLLPFFVMMELGGFINGSVVILWGLLAPIGAFVSGKLRQARYWFFAFLGLVIISGILQPYLRSSNNLPDPVIIIFFIINISAIAFITFLVLNYFVKNKDRVIELLSENRELEVAKLETEVMLRESDKLITLGRLSAGIAHELNNPASVAASGSKHLRETLVHFERNLYELGQVNLTKQQIQVYKDVKEQIKVRSKNQQRLDALARSDAEDKMESWLEKQNLNGIPELASSLVQLGFTVEELKSLSSGFTDQQFSAALLSIYTIYQSDNILEEISKGTDRIAEIVKSLKSYSYQEDAPLQTLNVHDGLNDTLIILRNQLKDGIDVQLNYDKNLPLIEARGNELTQVWTNIIDNAITAMNHKGEITIKTYKDDDRVVVEIKDNGPGIPQDVKEKIFDPFFTTKLPGEGTGLGLSISYNIVVNRHNGEIKVISKSGATCFQIKLPINNHPPLKQ